MYRVNYEMCADPILYAALLIFPPPVSYHYPRTPLFPCSLNTPPLSCCPLPAHGPVHTGVPTAFSQRSCYSSLASFSVPSHITPGHQGVIRMCCLPMDVRCTNCRSSYTQPPLAGPSRITLDHLRSDGHPRPNRTRPEPLPGLVEEIPPIEGRGTCPRTCSSVMR